MTDLQSFLAYGPWGIALLRAVTGVIFVSHGIPKLFGPQPGIAGFSGWLRSMHVPLASLFGVIVPVLEFFGGIALIVGLFTQQLGLLFAVQMLVATLLKATKMGKQFSGDGGWEFDLLLVAVALLLVVAGGGAFALDGRL